MKLTVSVAKYNGTGSIAHVEDHEERSIEVAGSLTMTAEKACLQAAKSLRAAADKFELLAKEAAPYNGNTHDKINSGRKMK